MIAAREDASARWPRLTARPPTIAAVRSVCRVRLRRAGRPLGVSIRSPRRAIAAAPRLICGPRRRILTVLAGVGGTVAAARRPLPLLSRGRGVSWPGRPLLASRLLAGRLIRDRGLPGAGRGALAGRVSFLRRFSGIACFLSWPGLGTRLGCGLRRGSRPVVWPGVGWLAGRQRFCGGLRWRGCSSFWLLAFRVDRCHMFFLFALRAMNCLRG
jgi:hypothetical protein